MPERKTVIYRFDNQGQLLSQHVVSADLTEALMATTSSGTTIVVGHHPALSPQSDDWKYSGVVLDADDRVVSRFELPSPPAGETLTFGSFDGVVPHLLMTSGDRAAYLLLHSDGSPTTMIATISESGEVHVKTVPETIADDSSRPTRWLVGPGVAAEKYSQINGKPFLVGGRPVHHFDEYDLKSGKRIASKTTPMGSATPFQAACYYGDSVTGLGSGEVLPNEPYLRLRIAKLQ